MWTVIWIEQISTSGCFVDFELYWIFRCVAFKPLGLLALSRDVNVNQNTLFIGPVIQIRFFLGTILFLLHRYHNLTENRASSVFLKITLSAMAWYRLKYFYTSIDTDTLTSIPMSWTLFLQAITSDVHTMSTVSRHNFETTGHQSATGSTLHAYWLTGAKKIETWLSIDETFCNTW